MATLGTPINQDIIIRVKFILEELDKGVKKIEQDVQKINQNINEATQRIRSAWDILFGNVDKGYKSFRTTAKNFADLLRAEFRWILGFEVIRGIENAFRFAISSMVELDYALAKVRAATLATDEEMRVLHQTILRISQTVPYSFEELGEALAVIVRAGIAVKDAGMFLETASKLALITGENLKNVAEFLVSVQKVYQFPVQQLPHIANLIAVALNKSKLALKDLIISWQYIAPTAKTANMSMEEVLATMMVLADKGLQASKIGTNLRQAMTYLIAPTTRLARMFKQFGLSLDDVNVLSRNFIQVLDLLREKGFGVQEAFQALGIRGATAFAYLLTSIDDIKQALAELTIADFINILEQATGYMKSTMRGTFQLLRNELAVTSVAFLDLIKPTTIDTMRGLIEILHILQGTFSILNSIISNQITTVGMFSTGIALLSGNYLQLNRSAMLLIGTLTGLATVFANIISKTLGLKEGLITTSDAIMVLVMAITALRAQTNGLMRFLLVIEAIVFGLEKLGNLARQLSGADFVQNIGNVATSISEMFKAKNIEEFRIPFESMRKAWKELPEDVRKSAENFDFLFGKIQNIQEAYQYFIKNQHKLVQELNMLPKVIDIEIEREKKLLESRKKQLETSEQLSKMPSFLRKFILKETDVSKLSQDIKELENRIQTLTSLKEKLSLFLSLLPSSMEKTSQAARKGITSLDDFQKFLHGVVEDASKIETNLDKVREGFSTLVLHTVEILKKHKIEVSQSLLATTLSLMNNAKSVKEAENIYNRFLQQIGKTGKLTSDILQEISIEAIRIIASPDVSKALQGITKETDRLATKQQRLAERLAELRQEVNNLLETEPYGIEYFERLFQYARKFESLEATREAFNIKQTAIGKLIEYLTSEEVMLAPRELMRLYRMLAEVELEPAQRARVFEVARQSFIKYVQTMVSGIGEVINVINVLLKNKKLIEVIFGSPEEINRIFDTLLDIIREVWEEGGIGLRQFISLKDKFGEIGKLYGTELSNKFLETITMTPAKSIDIFFRNLEILRSIFGRESDIIAKYIQINIERLTSADTLNELRRSFQYVIDYMDKFKESNISVTNIINQLIERSIQLYMQNRLSLPQIISLWEKWLETIKGLDESFSGIEENLRLLTLTQLIEGFRQGRISLEEYIRRLQDLLRLAERRPDYRTIIEALRQMGPALVETIATLREKWKKGIISKEDFEEFVKWEAVMNNLLNQAVQAAKEGKISFEELFSILRQYGEEGYMYIESITSSMSKQELVIYAIRDAFRKLRLDTKSDIEYMSDAFLSMSEKLRDAFTNTFVKIMKGQIKDLGDIWRQFIIDIVTLWQEALAKMAIAKLIEWLAPQVTTGGGIFGQIISGLLGVRFQYGGVAPKTPTIGILEKGERVLTAEQNRLFEAALAEMTKIAKRPIHTSQEVKIVNVVDPQSLSEFLMTSKGQEIVLNVISANRNRIFKILTTRR